MNKEEAIEKVKEHGEFYSNAFGGTVNMVPVGPIIDIISQIDEPKKVVIPKFVADLYEEIKDDFENKVYDLCVRFDSVNCKLSSEVWGWFDWGKNEPIQTLVKMKLYGYEIEQEKLYTVEIPNPNLNAHVVLQKTGEGIVLVTVGNTGWFEWESSKLTESEIKQDFEWAFQFAKPVEE